MISTLAHITPVEAPAGLLMFVAGFAVGALVMSFTKSFTKSFTRRFRAG